MQAVSELMNVNQHMYVVCRETLSCISHMEVTGGSERARERESSSLPASCLIPTHYSHLRGATENMATLIGNINSCL